MLIGAPCWGLSFPAALKVHLEHCSVCDVTFHYTPDARCEGLCRAARLTYITTCGGVLANANYGYDYLCGIATMFGILEARFAAAELLDVEEVDVAAIMAESRERVIRLRDER